MIITANEVTAISGIGGTIVGGFLALLGGWQAQRTQRNDRRTELRRDAYGSLNGALDRLYRLWDSPETLTIPGEQKVAGATGEAVGRIQEAYGLVRLVGSEDARAKASVAVSAAWDLSNLFNGPGEILGEMGPAFDAYTAAAEEFQRQAEAEVVP